MVFDKYFGVDQPKWPFVDSLFTQRYEPSSNQKKPEETHIFENTRRM